MINFSPHSRHYKTLQLILFNDITPTRSLIIAMMIGLGFGLSIQSAISLSIINFLGYTFVDDTDIVQSSKDPYDRGENIIPIIQEAIDHWEGGIRASGGVLVPKKCLWYLIDFKWANGKWTYRSKRDMPANLTIREDQDKVYINITRKESNEAVESLGIFLTMDGNNKKQVEYLKRKAEEFASNANNVHVSRF